MAEIVMLYSLLWYLMQVQSPQYQGTLKIYSTSILYCSGSLTTCSETTRSKCKAIVQYRTIFNDTWFLVVSRMLLRSHRSMKLQIMKDDQRLRCVVTIFSADFSRLSQNSVAFVLISSRILSSGSQHSRFFPRMAPCDCTLETFQSQLSIYTH